MNCFQHTQKSAVGTCSYCGRGLCYECAAVVTGKLSCRGSCQSEIAREQQYLQRSQKAIDQRATVLQTSGSIYHQSFAIVGFFGLVSIVLGIIMLLSSETVVGTVFVGIGVILILRGMGLARASKRFRSLAADDQLETTER